MRLLFLGTSVLLPTIAFRLVRTQGKRTLSHAVAPPITKYASLRTRNVTEKIRRRVRLKRTNFRVRRLSLNRSPKWTALLSTTPRLRPRLSTNDLAPLYRVCRVGIAFGTRTRLSASAKSRSAVALPPRGPKSVAAAYNYRRLPTSRRWRYRRDFLDGILT